MAEVQAASHEELGHMVDNTPEPLLEPPPKATADNKEGDSSSCEVEEEASPGTDKAKEPKRDETTVNETTEDVNKEETVEGESGVSVESMKLNSAFVALEMMRKNNLEVEFGGKAIPDVHLLHDYCTTCLYENKQKEEEKTKRLSKDEVYMSNPNREKRRMYAKQLMTRLRNRRKSPPCLICSSPVCNLHRCKEFQKEKINVCCKCSKLFTMDFVVTTMASSTEQEQRRKSIAHMVDSYDRALLILRYSAQYIDQIAEALENRSKMTDHIGLGSSSVGLLSGFTGVAAVTAQFVAAAAVLSPAGPPLVLASILFGASAAAASGGTEAVNYYSEPNQLACKIIALHDLVHSLVGVSHVLKGAIAQGKVDAHHYVDMKPDKKLSAYWKSRAPEISKLSVVETVDEEEEEDADEIEEFLESAGAKSYPKKTVASQEEQTREIANETSIDHEEAEDRETSDDMATENKETSPEPQCTTKPTYYSLSEIDDDETEPVLQEKKDGEISVTESSSFESEEEQDTHGSGATKKEESNPAPDTEDSPCNQEKEHDEEPTKKATFASSTQASRVSEGAATALLMSTVARRAGFGFITPQGQHSTTNTRKSNSNAVVKKESTDVVAPSNQRTAFTRTLTNSMKLAAFASIACCMLSAATIIMETKNLQDTLENMRRGSPCEKAAQLRKIKKEIEKLPDTKEIAEGWEAYLEVAARKNETKTE